MVGRAGRGAFNLRICQMTLYLHGLSQNTKQKVVAMETQYKLAARSAQLLAKDAPQDEAARVMATMATAKSQLSKVGFVLRSDVKAGVCCLAFT